MLASVAPVTVEEHMVYTTLSAILNIPYKPPSRSGRLPFPSKPLFLEMTVRKYPPALIIIIIMKNTHLYMCIFQSTPRFTPLLQMAAGHGWFAMDGIKVKVYYYHLKL